MRPGNFQKWISHPSYLLVCVGLGIFAWSFSFESPFQSKIQSGEVHTLQLSSTAVKLRREVEGTEYRALQKISDEDLRWRLERNSSKWTHPNGEHGVSLATLEATQQRSQKRLPKRFENNPVFQLLEKVSENVFSVEYEDQLVCDKSREFYESKLSDYSVLKDLMIQRNPATDSFTDQCVIYSMRQFDVPKMNFAACTKASGMPQVPGNKPCVTPNMVNLTYNSYMDVTQCLNLDPKHLMPKIDFESGFFLNAYGSEKEIGLGQLTASDIEEVNRHYPEYMVEVEKAAATKSSCANLMKFQSLLTPVQSIPEQRCSLAALPENPIRNILYMALLSRINMDKISGVKFIAGEDFLTDQGRLVPVHNNDQDEFTGLFKQYNIKEKLERAGFKNANLHFFKDLLTMLGYNTGVENAVKLLAEYLDQRLENNLLPTWNDFDFHSNLKETDLDGKTKNVIDVAGSYVMSSIVLPKDSAEVKQMKLRKRKEFPKLWAEAFRSSFPVFLAYHANGYTGKDLEAFPIYGYPGYINKIVDRQDHIRELFNSSSLNPNSCTDPNFLRPPDNSLKNVSYDKKFN